MRAAIMYIGFHYIHIDYGTTTRNYDWRVSYRNQQTYIYDDLRNRGYDIDVFMSSYTSEQQEHMLEDLKPVSYNFFECTGLFRDNRNYGRTRNVLKVLELFENYQAVTGAEYDAVILLRFDLMLLQPMSKLDIDYNGFNVGFLNYCGATYDDVFTFCLFHGKHMKKFMDYIKSERITQRFYAGGYNSHILRDDFKRETQIQDIWRVACEPKPNIFFRGSI
jgi:hypothetical protein